MALNKLDAIVFINLEHRKDREKLLREEFARLEVQNEKIHRLDACHDFFNGHRGCALSHIKALELAKEKKWNHVLILEDDVVFTKSKEEIENAISCFFSHYESGWDVFFLATNVFDCTQTEHPDFKRVISAQCAHAYLVNAHYYDTLLDCYYNAYHSMIGDDLVYEYTEKAIDQRWKPLQAKDRWYIGPLLGQQRHSYSDILHVFRSRTHKDV